MWQDAGHIHVENLPIDDLPAYQRKIGMVFQNYAVFPRMNVFENVACGLRNQKVAESEIKDRVARAMVIEPRVETRDEIRDIQKRLGITAIYVTHDQEEALAISDRIAVMNAGRIQQIGTPWEVYKEPSNRFVAQAGTDTLEKLLPQSAFDANGAEVAVRPEEIDDGAALALPAIVRKSVFIGSTLYRVVDVAEKTGFPEARKPSSCDVSPWLRFRVRRFRWRATR